jgi:ribosomal protein L6P/L9E
MRLRIPNLVSRPNEVPVVAETASGSDVEVAGSQEMNEKNGPQTQVNSKFEDDGVSPEVQHGVQVAQAINQVWSREHLIAAYIIIWVINFIQGFGSGITGVLSCKEVGASKANVLRYRHIDTLCHQFIPSTLAHRNDKHHFEFN